MKNNSGFSILLCALLALAGCAGGSRRPAEHIPSPSDTLYTERAAMLIYGDDPERALTIIDSARIVGNLDNFKADVLRAKVYANSVADQRLDKAIALGEDLLQRDSARAGTPSTEANRAHILQILMDASRQQQDEERWIKYAIQLAELNRSQGEEIEALRMEAEIGLAITYLGREEEGLAKLDQVIRTLNAGAPSVNRMDSEIIARKRKIIALDRVDRLEEAIPEANAIIQRLEDYERRPSAYAEDSFRMPPEVNRAPYIAFYKSQALAFLAMSYARKTPADLQEARKYLRRFEATDYARTLAGRQMIAPTWKALGEWDKLLAVAADTERQIGDDTLSANFASVLRDRADAATALGRPAEALALLNRYTAIQQELNRQRQESDAQEYAARYHADEQDRRIQDAVSKSARKDVIIGAVLMLLLLTIAFSYYLSCQQRMISQKNHALARMISEHSQAQEAAQSGSSSPSPAPDPNLFRAIDSTIREEQLYTNLSLQRQDILDRFNISRRTLSDLLAAYAGGQSFTAYINAMRLHDAVRLLREEPDLSISDIAEKTGFTPATLREQFKQKFGMTPTEYRQNI